MIPVRLVSTDPTARIGGVISAGRLLVLEKGKDMANEAIDSNDAIIPRAATRAAQFLSVIQQQVRQQGLDISLTPAKRGLRDPSVVLRAPLNVGRGNAVELEVFADPQGPALHAGWIAQRETLNGITQNLGLMRELDWLRNRNANSATAQRALSGTLQAFDGLVFRPVVQMLLEAVQAESAPPRNGFLGA